MINVGDGPIFGIKVATDAVSGIMIFGNIFFMAGDTFDNLRVAELGFPPIFGVLVATDAIAGEVVFRRISFMTGRTSGNPGMVKGGTLPIFGVQMAGDTIAGKMVFRRFRFVAVQTGSDPHMVKLVRGPLIDHMALCTVAGKMVFRRFMAIRAAGRSARKLTRAMATFTSDIMTADQGKEIMFNIGIQKGDRFRQFRGQIFSFGR